MIVGNYRSIPFIDGGRSLTGADCWGLIYLIYKRELKIELPHYGEISARQLRQIALAFRSGMHSSEIWHKVEDRGQHPFDIVVMSAQGGNSPIHVGIMTNRTHILHTELGVGVIHQSLTDPLISSRLHGIYRYMEDANVEA